MDRDRDAVLGARDENIGDAAINVNSTTLCNVGIVNFEADTKKARMARSTIEWGAVGRNVQLTTRVYFWGCAPRQRTNPHSFFVSGVHATRSDWKRRFFRRNVYFGERKCEHY